MLERSSTGEGDMPTSATATFLFCDLVGSTALLTRLGDDAGDEVRRQCYGEFRRAMSEYRGTARGPRSSCGRP